MTQKMLLLFSSLGLIGVVAQAQEIGIQCFPREIQKREVEHGNEKDDDDVADTEVEVRKRREVASGLGIVPDDLSSVTEISSRCCGVSSPLCVKYGGICLPPMYKPFFTCYKDGLCSDSCICFLKPDNCKCNGPCENGGTCKSRCSSLEGTVKSSICGPNCQCCVDCEAMPMQGIGQCKKACAKHELSDGPCSKGSSCMCCVDRCGNQKCGFRGTCRTNCLGSETNTGLQCKGIGCTCCETIISEGPRPLPVEMHRSA